MKLLTKENLKALPAPYSQENNPDPICHVKLFTPWGNWNWFLIEYNPESEEVFAYVEGFEKELGYVSITELRQITGPAGLKIERDRHFTPKPLSEIKKNSG